MDLHHPTVTIFWKCKSICNLQLEQHEDHSNLLTCKMLSLQQGNESGKLAEIKIITLKIFFGERLGQMGGNKLNWRPYS